MEFCDGTSWKSYATSSSSVVYVSSGELAVPFNSMATWSHGKGLPPKYFGAYLICKVAEVGYSINDMIDVSSGWNQSAETDVGHSAGANSTNLWFSQSGLYGVAAMRKDGAIPATLTRANWRLVLWAVW